MREWLSVVPDFSGITAEEFDGLVDYMLEESYLFLSGGLLSMGDETERAFGRKNFMELYAVFSSPVRYRVLTAQKQEIGTLEQNFVDSLVDNVTTFLLGGRAWVAEHVNHTDRTVRVHPAPGGKRPSWGGYIPQMLSCDLCQQVRRTLTDDREYPYVSDAMATALRSKRAELGSPYANRACRSRSPRNGPTFRHRSAAKELGVSGMAA